jgi:DNA-binding protein HU-beta
LGAPRSIKIAGLGILLVRKRAARMGRNPMNGEAIKIKASRKVAFRAAKDLKMAI